MLTVIGCGNLNRSDDGVGVIVAQRLQERLRKHPVPEVQVFDCGTAGVDVMFKARGSTSLLILDAAQTGSTPGAIFDVPGEALAQDHAPTYSLHDFRWDHALAAGRKIFKTEFPTDVRVWLIEAATVEYGLTLSVAVEAAAETVYRRALKLIADFAAHRHDRGPTERLEVRRGSLHLSKETYDKYFGGREGVLLMEREGQALMVPVDQVDGGLLVKQRNLRGDRVILGAEFLHAHGVERFEGEVELFWDSELGALSFTLRTLDS